MYTHTHQTQAALEHLLEVRQDIDRIRRCVCVCVCDMSGDMFVCVCVHSRLMSRVVPRSVAGGRDIDRIQPQTSEPNANVCVTHTQGGSITSRVGWGRTRTGSGRDNDGRGSGFGSLRRRGCTHTHVCVCVCVCVMYECMYINIFIHIHSWIFMMHLQYR